MSYFQPCKECEFINEKSNKDGNRWCRRIRKWVDPESTRNYCHIEKFSHLIEEAIADSDNK